MPKEIQTTIEMLNLDIESNGIKEAISIFSKTKTILERTHQALGRTVVEYEVINMSSSNSYNISTNERFTTY